MKVMAVFWRVVFEGVTPKASKGSEGPDQPALKLIFVSDGGAFSFAQSALDGRPARPSPEFSIVRRGAADGRCCGGGSRGACGTKKAGSAGRGLKGSKGMLGSRTLSSMIRGQNCGRVRKVRSRSRRADRQHDG